MSQDDMEDLMMLLRLFLLASYLLPPPLFREYSFYYKLIVGFCFGG